jgi:hypothetical protein
LDDEVTKLRLEKTAMELQLVQLQAGREGHASGDVTGMGSSPVEGVSVKCPNNCGGLLSVHSLQVRACLSVTTGCCWMYGH